MSKAVMARQKSKTVMRGLDPRIHLFVASTRKMDRRVKPGDDDLAVLKDSSVVEMT